MRISDWSSDVCSSDLLQHLARDRADVQSIDLMIGAGFCRNCLADWYREAAEARGLVMTRDEARKAIYGEPFAQWKAKHQREEHGRASSRERGGQDWSF